MKYNLNTPPNWQQIDTVLLDMDGTLLDLHFDNYFWQSYIPQCYAKHHQLSLAAAMDKLNPHFTRLRGQIEWYCLDYWTELTGLPIAKLKYDVADKIQYRPQAQAFLRFLRAEKKRSIIITNAHPDSVHLKMQKTDLHTEVDNVISSHRYAKPKEDPLFWQQLQAEEPFALERTLFIDDSHAVLTAAAAWGIKWLVSINTPDSTLAANNPDPFFGINNFAEIMPTSIEI